jgi:hypothetical protein
MALVVLCLIGQILLAEVADALVPKQGGGALDSLAFVSEALQVSAVSESFDDVRMIAGSEIVSTWDTFRTKHGAWSAVVDKRTGKIEVAEGEGIPFVPGRGNQLQITDISADLGDDREIDLARMEAITRAFLPRVAGLLGIDPSTLILNQGRSGHPADYLWYVDFDVTYDGTVVEGARVVFRVNSGNLIQFGSENLPAEGSEVPKAKVTRNQALKTVAAYIGGFGAADSFVDGGSEHLVPVALANSIERGKGRGLARIWQFVFRRNGDHGTWRARVDATSGGMLEFRDINDYATAQVTGGVKTSLSEAKILPMPFADVSSAVYTNSAGLYYYTSGNVASALNGQYVRIIDTCGVISMTSDASGNFAFGTSSGTDDCDTPGSGGAGNTRSSRTQFYYLNRAKEIARGWISNPWLTSQVTANVNLADTDGDGICNAFWDGVTLNLYKKSGSCSNSGEIQAVGLHEFGHGLDGNDGSGPSLDKGTGETYGDWMAALTTHDSCIGAGYLSSNCDGFGDACTSCTGVRDIDYAKHSSGAPHTVGNFTQVRCPDGGGYNGPCLQEGHCESYVSSEALWDLAVRDLPNPGTDSAWAIMDRLWYLSRSTATAAFTCFRTTPTWTSDGCGTGSLWKTLRAVDDDDGNLSNGTPHSAALYAAFSRHGIACASDAGANTSFRGCAQPATLTLSLAAANNQVTLNWSGSTGVYDIYRNEQGCNAGGFIKVANDLTASSFIDSDVANDFVYYYKVVAQPSGYEACASAPSSCLEAAPCLPPAAPAGLTANLVGANQIDLSWADSPGATRYHIYRATTAGGPYTRIATRSGNTFSDTSLSCGKAYYYVVRAAKNDTCESGNSTQTAATTTGCSLTISKSGEGTGTVTSTPVGINCGADCSELYSYNTSVTLTATPEVAFTGWSGACAGTGTCTVSMTQARSVTASFAVTYTLTVVGWDIGAPGIVTSSPAGINCQSSGVLVCFGEFLPNTSVTLTGVPREGYGCCTWWHEDASIYAGTTHTVAMTQNLNMQVSMPGPFYTLTVNLAGTGNGTVTSTPAGINCGADCSSWYYKNTSVTLTATPEMGSVFSGWSGACTGTGTCTVTMDQKESVTAAFAKGPLDFYTVTPCRVLDTRSSPGTPLTSGIPLSINVAGTCGVPSTAKAVSLNLTAIQASNYGGITLYSGDISAPGTTTIGFGSLTTRANNAIMPLAIDGIGTLKALATITGGGTVDIAVDVNGYFK